MWFSIVFRCFFVCLPEGTHEVHRFPMDFLRLLQSQDNQDTRFLHSVHPWAFWSCSTSGDAHVFGNWAFFWGVGVISSNINIYIYIYVYYIIYNIYTCVCMYIYIYCMAGYTCIPNHHWLYMRIQMHKASLKYPKCR